MKISAPRLMGRAFPGMTMAEEWWLAILLLLFGALFLVGLVTEAQLSCDEKRRSRGMVPIQIRCVFGVTSLADLRRGLALPPLCLC